MLQVGFELYIVYWILSCVQSMSFAVLLNGATSIFFRYGRGLRQGCPLDPLLFFLIMEGLSRAIHHAKWNGTLKGIRIGGNVVVSHMLLLAGKCCCFNWLLRRPTYLLLRRPTSLQIYTALPFELNEPNLGFIVFLISAWL